MNKTFELFILLLLSIFCSCSKFGYIQVTEEQRRQNPQCPVSLEENTGENSILIRTDHKVLGSYNIESAYELFIICGLPHPLNRRKLNLCEKARIQTYYYFLNNPVSFGERQILDIFKLVLLGNRDDHNIQILRRYLTFDLTDKFFSGIHDMKVDESNAELRQQFVTLAGKSLEGKEVGSWLIRPSSLFDSKELSIEVRSITYFGWQNNRGFIGNYRFAHAVGYGYLLLSRATKQNGRELVMNDFSNFNIFTSPFIMERYGSLIDLLLDFNGVYLHLPMFCRLSRSDYTVPHRTVPTKMTNPNRSE